jgi:hypothetical protein
VDEVLYGLNDEQLRTVAAKRPTEERIDQDGSGSDPCQRQGFDTVMMERRWKWTCTFMRSWRPSAV